MTKPLQDGSPGLVGLPIPRRMLPRAMRRAVALAIEMERTHDHLAAHTGCVPPIADRIAPIGSTTVRRKGRLNLPKDLSHERIAEMHMLRLAAIEDLCDEIGPTLGDGEIAPILTLVAEAREIAGAERHEAPGLRVRSRSPVDDGLSPREVARMAICAMADASAVPERAPAMQPAVWTPPIRKPSSISIELVIEGLLDRLGIDRDGLHVELEAFGSEAGSRSILLASPSARSNYHPTLHALGTEFPPAIFQLRGDSLDVMQLELSAADPEDYYDVWTYSGGHVSRPTLTRHGAMRGVPIHTYPRRAVAEVLKDDRFHPALLIEKAGRIANAEGASVKTVLSLFPRYALLDPPGRHVERPRPVAADAIPLHLHAHRDLAIDVDYEQIILAALIRRGHPQQVYFRSRYNQHLTFSINSRTMQKQHTFVITIETLREGVDAIHRRIDEIVEVIDAPDEAEQARQQSLRDAEQARAEALAKAREKAKAAVSIATSDRTVPAVAGTSTRLRGLRASFADAFPDFVGLLDRVVGIDMLFARMLDDQWKHPYVARTSRALFRVEDDCLVLESASLGDIADYSLVDVRKEGGPVNGVAGRIRINRSLDDTTIRAMEGRSLSDLMEWNSGLDWPVRQVERRGLRTTATIELPVVPL